MMKPSRFQSFETALKLRENSFGFLRLFLAFSVLYHHSFVLGGFGQEPIAQLINFQENVGSLAVVGFFIISGFLVTNSLFHSPSVIVFGVKRFLRIFPAFWVCLLITALIFSPLVAYFDKRLVLSLLFLPNGIFGYIQHNFFIFMHQYTIADLLKNNPFPSVFNGSLWTLILEIKAYILLGLLGLVGLVRKRFIIVIIFGLLYLLFVSRIIVPEPSNKFLHFFIDNSVFTFFMYFLSGVIFYLYRGKIPFSINLFIITIFLTILSIYFQVFHQILTLTFPYILFWLAASLPFQNATRFGDFSYGIYIYAFPIQQLLTFFHFNIIYPVYLILSAFLTLIFAVVSWLLIENPALKLKKVAANIYIRNLRNYFFAVIKPRTVPSSTAKSAVNWRRGKKRKARKSLT